MVHYVLTATLLLGSTAQAARTHGVVPAKTSKRANATLLAASRLLDHGIIGTRETHLILLRHSVTDSLLIAQNKLGESLEYRIDNNRPFLLLRTPNEIAGTRIDRADLAQHLPRIHQAFPRLDAKWLRAQDLRWHLEALTEG